MVTGFNSVDGPHHIQKASNSDLGLFYTLKNDNKKASSQAGNFSIDLMFY